MGENNELGSPYKEMEQIVRLYRVVTGFAERQWIAAKVASDDRKELQKLKDGATSDMPEGVRDGEARKK
jgi:hypothetical protein